MKRLTLLLGGIVVLLGTTIYALRTRPFDSELEDVHSPAASPSRAEEADTGHVPGVERSTIPAERLGLAWTVRVESTQGVRLVGAKVYATRRASERMELLGVTNDLGQLECRVDRTGFESVLATAVGFQPTQARLPDMGELICLVLQPGGTIRGLVSDESGTPMGADVAVFAWKASSNVDGAHAVSSGLRGDPIEALTMTDAAGRFLLDGVEPGARYYLVAAGHGAATRQLSVALVGEDLDHRLEAAWIYGARLVARSSTGEAIPAFASDVKRARWRSSSEDAEAKACVLPAPCLVLLGLPDAGSDDSARVCLYASTRRRDHVGPNRVELELPGYALRSSSFDALPVEWALNEVELTLTQTCAGFGDLEVQFVASESGSHLDFVPEGTLTVVTPGAAPLGLAVTSGPTTLHRFRHLPLGEYSTVFQAETSMLRSPASGESAVVIRKGERASLTIELPALCGIAITVQDASGAEYTGPIDFNLGIGRPRVLDRATTLRGISLDAGSIAYGPTTSHHFGQAPYRIGGLSGGTYSVVLVDRRGVGSPSIEWPAGVPFAVTIPAMVSLAPGESSACSFVLSN